jgi:ATP-dependent DNA helicase RecQ
MLKNRMSVVEILKGRGLTISTVLSHIQKCIEENKELPDIDFTGIFTEEEEKEIMKAIDEVGMEKLTPIKKLVSQSISFDTIKAVILKNYVM